MPNRILKESICTSEDLNTLSQGAEILFYRLMVKADDYGIYYANASIVRSTCFPLKADDIKSSQVESWLTELSKAGIIFIYKAEDGRKYLQFCKWSKHQQTRATKPKYPVYDEACNQLISDDCKCPRIRIRNSDKKSGTDSETKQKRFTPPSLAEIEAYCRERGNHVDPKKFFDYYSEGEWRDKDGKPVRNWKQKMISVWEKEEPQKPADTWPGKANIPKAY